MARYLILNLVVIGCLILAVSLWPMSVPRRKVWIIGIVLLVLTAVFDSLIIAAGIVNYDPTKIIGVYLGKAPIEDFAYTLAAVIIVPYTWKRYGRKD